MIEPVPDNETATRQVVIYQTRAQVTKCLSEPCHRVCAGVFSKMHGTRSMKRCDIFVAAIHTLLNATAPAPAEKMDVKEIVIAYLKANNFDGLCAESCGCAVDNLAPCEAIGDLCRPAYERKCGRCGDRFFTDGDTIECSDCREE